MAEGCPTLTRPCRTVVEFGAGGGHLGLVLAALFPSTTFVLLELGRRPLLVSGYISSMSVAK